MTGTYKELTDKFEHSEFRELEQNEKEYDLNERSMNDQIPHITPKLEALCSITENHTK